MQPLDLKPTHKLVKNYYQALGQLSFMLQEFQDLHA